MTTEIDQQRIIMVHPDQIHPNPNNPRREAGDVSDLARSIKEHGLYQPLLVIQSPYHPGQYMLDDGYRRWVAGKSIGVELSCIVRLTQDDEDLAIRVLVTALVTDLKEHLTPMERAKAYGQLRNEGKMTQDQIAEKLGVTASTVSRYMALLELSDRSQTDVRTGKLSVEKAVDAVQRNRAKNRQKEGKKPVDVGWEPDHFSVNHHLARKARVMCDARDHNNRRRHGGACGACWETVIRQDQDRVNRAAELSDSVPLVPISPDGNIRVSGGVRGAQ